MKKRLIAIFAVVALLLTLIAIPVFADDDVIDGEEITDVGSTGSDDTTTTGTGNTEVTVDGGDNIVEDPFDLEDDTTEPTEKNAAAEESKGLSTFAIWNIVIGGVVLAIVIALVVVFFFLPKRREKTLKFFRSLKSEWKKISWFSWKNTWKGTLIVAIVSIVIAIVVGLLDMGFIEGIKALADLF